jgi:hypothetical protein
MWSNMNLDPGVLICPTAGKKITNGYGYNVYLSGVGMGEVTDPAETVMTADSGFRALTPNIMSDYDVDVDPRHSGSIVVGCVDGHVETCKLLGSTSYMNTIIQQLNIYPSQKLVASLADINVTNTLQVWTKGTSVTLPTAALKSGSTVPAVKFTFTVTTDTSAAAASQMCTQAGFVVSMYDPGNVTPTNAANWQLAPEGATVPVPVAQSVGVGCMGDWNYHWADGNSHGENYLYAAYAIPSKLVWSTTTNGTDRPTNAMDWEIQIIPQTNTVYASVKYATSKMIIMKVTKDVSAVMGNNVFTVYKNDNYTKQLKVSNIKVYTL